MKELFDENICAVVDYERYLADKYDFCPINYNQDDVWDTVIKRESRGKYSVWYKKFIKKYYQKKLLPNQHLRTALLIAGCDAAKVDNVIQRNDAKEIVHYFRKNKKKRKIRCFYKGN